MKKIVLFSTIIVTVLLLSGCSGLINSIGSIFNTSGIQNTGVSARQWFNYVENVAQEWREDAYLYGILDSNVSFDGKSNNWTYLFYSPDGGKSIMIEYDHGFITQKEQARNPLREIKNWKIDSPIAVQLAIVEAGAEQFIAENDKVSVTMALISYPDEPQYRRELPYWNIKFYGDRKTLKIKIDAVSGKVIN